ncbi:MAG: glycosyltransferase family 2 protein [Bacteroidota bacterium]
MKDLAVIMPVYNEEEIIETVVKDWHDQLTKLNIDFDIHAYNDGSKDGTLDILNSISSDYKQLVVHDKRNSGHGPTILKGYKDNQDYEWLFQIDSDNELKAKHFHLLWDDRANYDFMLGARDNRSQPLPRRVISAVSRMVVRVLYSNKVHDVNAPYRLMNNNLMREYICTIPDHYFAPNVVVSGIAGYINARVKEVKVPHEDRQTGEVSIKKWKLFMSACKSFVQTFQFRIFYLSKK